MGLHPLKQEPLIIPVHRFGRDKNMTVNVIFGLWDVLYMKCALYFLLLGLRIFLVCLKLYLMVLISRFLENIQKI